LSLFWKNPPFAWQAKSALFPAGFSGGRSGVARQVNASRADAREGKKLSSETVVMRRIFL
jgi:hypothetical protein